ncbi:MAG TPA: signal peptidase II [Pirellulales bacterium]|nr:signal peptidase II [Pirellulales bacterium]
MATTPVPASRIALFLGLIIVGCAADLATKHWIFAKLGMPYESPPIVLAPGVFSLTTSLNEGALFGLGQGMTWVFAGLSVLAAMGIFYWLFFAGAGHDWWLTVALGVLMAGIFGNLYDRLGLPGLVWEPPNPRAGQVVHAVRDWLHLEIRKIHFDWPVFNLADSLLVLGACMLFWHVAWRERNRRAADNAPVDSARPSIG